MPDLTAVNVKLRNINNLYNGMSLSVMRFDICHNRIRLPLMVASKYHASLHGGEFFAPSQTCNWASDQNIWYAIMGRAGCLGWTHVHVLLMEKSLRRYLKIGYWSYESFSYTIKFQCWWLADRQLYEYIIEHLDETPKSKLGRTCKLCRWNCTIQETFGIE